MNDEMIYILLPVHNRVSITLDFVDCLLKQTYPAYQLILIDDGSTDGTAEAVCARCADTVVLRGNGELWWAGCLNLGMDWLIANEVKPDSLVLIINDDVVFDTDFLQTASTLFTDLDFTLLLARERNPESGEIVESGIHADLRSLEFTRADSSGAINCLSTRGLFLRWKDMLQIGRFRDKILPHYWTDYEYTIRAYKKGYKLKTDERLYLMHDINDSNDKKYRPDKLTVSELLHHRHTLNPLAWSKFVILTSPWPHLLTNLFRVWYRTCKQHLF